MGISEANWGSEKHRVQMNSALVLTLNTREADIHQAVLFARAQPVISKRSRCRGAVIICLLCSCGLQPGSCFVTLESCDRAALPQPGEARCLLALCPVLERHLEDDCGTATPALCHSGCIDGVYFLFYCLSSCQVKCA